MFDFDKELVKFCHDDVTILALGLQEFRKKFIRVTSLDPIRRCVNLPSVAFEVFRARILHPKSIGITPVGGYSTGRKSSASANIYLDYVQHTLGREIYREYRIGRV